MYQEQVLDFLDKILELVCSKMCIHTFFKMQKHYSSDAFCFNSLAFITFSNIVSVFIFF